MEAQRALPTLCAPGVAITAARASTAKGPAGLSVDKQGTSMAAPHVAGVAALMLKANPALTHAELRTLLSAEAAGPNDPNRWGAGRLDGLKAVKAASTRSSRKATVSR